MQASRGANSACFTCKLLQTCAAISGVRQESLPAAYVAVHDGRGLAQGLSAGT